MSKNDVENALLKKEIGFLNDLIRLGTEVINIPLDSIYPTLKIALKAASLHMDCDRAYFAEYDADNEAMIIMADYTGEGVSHHIGTSVSLPDRKTDSLLTEFLDGLPVIINDVEKLPGHSFLRKIHEMYHIKSAMVKLIFYDNRPRALLGFSNFRQGKLWSDQDKNVFYIFGSFLTNLVSRKYYEEKLLHTRNDLSLAIQTSGLCIWDLDVKEQIVMVRSYDLESNSENKKWLKKPAFLQEYIHPNYTKQVARMLSDCETGNANSMELIIKGATLVKANTWLDFRARAASYNKHGKVIRIRGSMLDISHLKEAEGKVATALHMEKKNINIKNRLISIASHEFRTPLSVISAATDSIIEYHQKMDYEAILYRMQKIKKQERIMHGLVRNIINMDKIQTGKIQISLVFEDLASYAIEMVAEFNEQYDAQNGNLENPVKHRIGRSKIFTAFDRDIMRMIVWNLLDNAIKYAQSENSVEVYLVKQEQHVLLSVRDSGKGIAKELLPVVFDEFTRGSDSTNIKGSGLGLVIVKEGVNLHGGRLEIDSGEDKGTTVNCFFPIKELAETI